MKITPIKIRKLIPPKDDLLAAILKSSIKPKEGSIVAVSSKVVAIHQGRCIPLSEISNKDDLIKKEAEKYLERNLVPGEFIIHSLKNHMLVGSAGIDESNANKHYVLLPEKPEEFAKQLWLYFKKQFKIQNLGIIITDSHSVPLRRGTVGISIASYGFKPLYSYRGQPDLFNRELTISISNLADGLAAAATAVMGEGREQTPIADIAECDNIEFIQEPYAPANKYESFYVSPKEDLFKPFFDYLPWKEGGSAKGSKKP